MSQYDAIWHALIGDEQRGPMSRAQVMAHLRDGSLGENDFVWRPGFEDWVPLREVREFWNPPSRSERKPEVVSPPLPQVDVATPPSPVPSTSREPAAMPELQKIRLRRPRNLAILGAITLYSLYLGLQQRSIILGLLSGLFAGLVVGAVVVGIVELLVSIADLFRTKFPRTAYWIGTIAFWLGILLFVYFAGLVGYMIYEAAPIRLVLMVGGVGVFYGLLGWALQRGLAAGFKDVRKR
jgi:hypothetical protein